MCYVECDCDMYGMCYDTITHGSLEQSLYFHKPNCITYSGTGQFISCIYINITYTANRIFCFVWKHICHTYQGIFIKTDKRWVNHKSRMMNLVCINWTILFAQVLWNYYFWFCRRCHGDTAVSKFETEDFSAQWSMYDCGKYHRIRNFSHPERCPSAMWITCFEYHNLDGE